jgi:hypothetical protein
MNKARIWFQAYLDNYSGTGLMAVDIVAEQAWQAGQTEQREQDAKWVREHVIGYHLDVCETQTGQRAAKAMAAKQECDACGLKEGHKPWCTHNPETCEECGGHGGCPEDGPCQNCGQTGLKARSNQENQDG